MFFNVLWKATRFQLHLYGMFVRLALHLQLYCITLILQSLKPLLTLIESQGRLHCDDKYLDNPQVILLRAPVQQLSTQATSAKSRRTSPPEEAGIDIPTYRSRRHGSRKTPHQQSRLLDQMPEPMVWPKVKFVLLTQYHSNQYHSNYTSLFNITQIIYVYMFFHTMLLLFF